MPAKITSIIPADNFELVRDQIGGVVFVELANQHTLDNTFIAPAKVWIERFVPLNTLTETPFVNVRYKKGDPDESSREATQTKYRHTYCIDVSVKAKSTTALTGDQQATLYLHKMIRMIRSILSNPLYNKIALSIPIGRRYITSIEVMEPMEMQDATNQADGIIEFCVEVPEYAANPVTGAPLNEITTTAKLYNTELGYYWDYIQKAITVDTSDADLTDSFFSNDIVEIYNNTTGVIYVSNTDFTQSGTTITGVTFSFVSGQIITAKTA